MAAPFFVKAAAILFTSIERHERALRCLDIAINEYLARKICRDLEVPAP
jgi:hypothetical protein